MIRQSGERNIRVSRQNFFKANVSDATFIYLYLFPKPVDRLASKFEREVEPGTKILSPSFPIDLKKHPAFSLKKEQKIGNVVVYLYEKL